MSKRADRFGLAPLSDSAPLARTVPQLAPEALHQLIQHRGLEASGAIAAAATPQQLAAVFDLDLWRAPAAGGDELFDEQRFGFWIETLMEEGETVAARVVSEMDRELAVTGLSRLVRVFDPGVFLPTFSSDDEAGREPIAASKNADCEVGGYVVRARTAGAWDAIVGLLIAMAAEHPEAFHALMRGCRDLSFSTPEIDGLDNLLGAPEQQLHDVAIDRDDRRAERGYVSAVDARAFLQACRAKAPRSATLREPQGRPELGRGATALAEPAEDPSDALNRDLAFLANALMSGASVPSGSLEPQEAWNIAVGVCRLGVETTSAPPASSIEGGETALVETASPEAFLIDRDVIAAFEAGWRLLYEDVSRFVAKQLIDVLADLRSEDRDIQRDLNQLRRELARNLKLRTPVCSPEVLEVIALLDMPAWACLRGLLNECPVLPAAVAATLDGQTKSVSATAFECFTTRAQFRRVREFAARLRPILLS